MFWGRDKSLVPAGNQTLTPQLSSLFTYSLYQLSYPGSWDTLQGLLDFKFPKQCSWEIRSFGMWCFVTGCALLMIEGRSAFIFMGQAVPWRWRHYISLKEHKPINQQHSITSQKIWIIKSCLIFPLVTWWFSSSSQWYGKNGEVFILKTTQQTGLFNLLQLCVETFYKCNESLISFGYTINTLPKYLCL